MIFDIDVDTVLDSIISVIDREGMEFTQEQMNNLVRIIDNALPGLLNNMIIDTKNEWTQQALEAKGWGTKYIQAIKLKFEKDGGSVYLDPNIMDKSSNRPFFMFALMMENGVKSWSIKDALLASKKAHTGKDGVKYITIPFPVHTPGKDGKMASKFGGRKMTTDMHALVKAGEKVPEGTTINVKNTIRSFEVDITGLTRYNTRQFHSQYGIFRRVSSRSEGWQYPDIPAQPIFPSVVDYVHRRITEDITAFCQEVVREFSE